MNWRTFFNPLQRAATQQPAPAREPEAPARPASLGTPQSDALPARLPRDRSGPSEIGPVHPQPMAPRTRLPEQGRAWLPSQVELPAGTRARLSDLLDPRHIELPQGTKAKFSVLLQHVAQAESSRAQTSDGPDGPDDRPSALHEPPSLEARPVEPPGEIEEEIEVAPPDGGAAAAASTSQQPTAAPEPLRPTRQVPINKLPSEMKIDLSKTPNASIVELEPDQQARLAQALGVASLGDSDEARHARTAAAARRIAGVDLQVFEPYDGLNERERLKETPLYKSLPRGKATQLADLAEATHMSVREVSVTDPRTGERRKKFDISFGGAQKRADDLQNRSTALGGVGKVYEAARAAAALVAEALAGLQDVELNRISGISMGGGTGQVFAAALLSRIKLPSDPVLVLFDPPLLNNEQARYAVDGGDLGYDFSKPRGVIITLDYARNSRKTLVDRMQHPGRYTAPGLLHLQLGLDDGDGRKATKAGLKATKPKPSGPPGTGYHANRHLYETAIARFAGRFRELGRRDEP